jgi:hypothetical protein
MALGEVQTALARLLTDTAARAMFARDPFSAGRALGLDEADARSVAALAPQALDRFGASLKSKRALDARKLLPLTALALGDAFGPRLREALQARPGGAAADAIALASRLAADTAASPPWIGDLARYEAAFIAARRRPWGVQLRLFRYPVPSIAAALHGGVSPGVVAPRTTVGLWARAPGQALVHRCWAMPHGSGSV